MDEDLTPLQVAKRRTLLQQRDEARKVEEATEEQTVKSEPEIKQEVAEETAKTPTSVPSPQADA